MKTNKYFTINNPKLLEKFKRTADNIKKITLQSQESAHKALINDGIIDKHGNLKKNYGKK